MVQGENLFIIEFEYEWDKSRVFEGRPWIFYGNLFSVEDFDGLTPLSHINLKNAVFFGSGFTIYT